MNREMVLNIVSTPPLKPAIYIHTEFMEDVGQSLQNKDWLIT